MIENVKKLQSTNLFVAVATSCGKIELGKIKLVFGRL